MYRCAFAAFGPSLRFAVTHHRYDVQRSVGCCSDFMEFGLDPQSMYLALRLREILLTNWKARDTHTHTYREIRSTFLPPIIPWVFASDVSWIPFFLVFLAPSHSQALSTSVPQREKKVTRRPSARRVSAGCPWRWRSGGR